MEGHDGGGNGEVMVGGMASFSRTAKDLELKPRNVHSPGALPLLRGKTAKARVVIFFFSIILQLLGGGGGTGGHKALYSHLSRGNGI